jgi:hypothetical protein
VIRNGYRGVKVDLQSPAVVQEVGVVSRGGKETTLMASRVDRKETQAAPGSNMILGTTRHRNTGSPAKISGKENRGPESWRVHQRSSITGVPLALVIR